MDISTLPEGILLEALKLLPFREVVRLSRVNQRFQQISEMVISKTKEIYFLRSEPTKNPTPEAFAQLLDLCKANLVKVVFPDDTKELVEVFSAFSFPQLKRIVIDIDQTVLWKLFLNNDNLRDFHFHSEVGLEAIPPNACKYLESLHIPCRNITLVSLAKRGQFSQLKELALSFNEITPLTGQLLDEAFGQLPSIEKLELIRDENEGDADGEEEESEGEESDEEESDDAGGEEEEGEESDEEQENEESLINLHDLQHFWRLSNLVELGIFVKLPPETADNTLVKIGASFPQLESLTFGKKNYATDAGVLALATLKNLKYINFGMSDIDNGLRYLAEQGRLEDADLYCFITPATFTSILQSSPKLRRMWIGGILTTPDLHSEDTVQMAATIIESISAPFKIDLVINVGNACNREIWESEEVKVVLEKLKERDGHT